MPPLPMNVDVDGANQFRRAAAELKLLAGKGFHQRLTNAVRAQSRPVLNEVRAKVVTVEVWSTRGGTAPPSYSRNLRRRIAGATYVSVRADGVSFRVSGKRIGPYGTALARYMDSELPKARNWRHPVFQNPQRTKPWTVQRGEPWFFVTIRRNRDEFERAIRRALADMEREIRL